MKSLIDFNEVKKFITERRRKLIDHFCEYRWDNGELSIDDAIADAKTTKALELALRDIKSIVPSNDDIVRVNNAVVALAGHGVLKGTPEYDAHIKTVADYLGIPLPKDDSKDNNEE